MKEASCRMESLCPQAEGIRKLKCNRPPNRALAQRGNAAQAVAWAARHSVRIIDVQLDGGDNAFTRIDAVRAS